MGITIGLLRCEAHRRNELRRTIKKELHNLKLLTAELEKRSLTEDSMTDRTDPDWWKK